MGDIVKRFYIINPGSHNGEMVMYIKYNDGEENMIPYEPFKTINDRVKIKVNEYIAKLRKQKIDKILNGKRL